MASTFPQAPVEKCSPGCSGLNLPYEIVDLIFSHLQIPKALLESTLMQLQKSPWRQASRKTFLSLSRVCRAWNLAAIGYLYESVTFEDLDQMCAFVRTLKATPSRYRESVKEVTVYAFIFSSAGDSFTNYLRQIPHLCSSLRSFNFLPRFALAPTVFFPKFGQITSLSINLVSSNILILLGVICDSLTSLSIFVSDWPPIIDEGIQYHLPRLESLIVEIQSNQVLDLAPIINVLQAPRLQRFTFFNPFRLRFVHSESLRIALLCFLVDNGQEIRFLHLVPTKYSTWSDLDDLLEACPVLEHLVIEQDECPLLERPEITYWTHPTVKWLDVGVFDAVEPLQPWTMMRAQRVFDGLLGFREIHADWKTFQAVLSLMPPDSTWSTDSQPMKCNLPGLSIYCEDGIIRSTVEKFSFDVSTGSY